MVQSHMTDPRTVRLEAALADHRAGKLDDAAAGYRSLLADRPDDGDALTLLGALLLQRGDLETALDLLARAVRTLPRSAAAHQNLGMALSRAGRWREAVRMLEAAAALDPGISGIWRGLAGARAAIGDTVGAIQAYRRLVAIAPDDAEALNNIGVLLLQAGDLDQAQPVLERAAALRPADSQIQKNLGSLWVQRRRFDRAESALRRAAEGDPTSADTWIGFAGALNVLNRFAESHQAFARAHQLDPGRADALLGVAGCADALGRPDEAAAALDRIDAMVPGHAGAAHYRSALLLRRERFAEGWAANLSAIRGSDAYRAVAGTVGVPAWDGSPLDGATVLLHASDFGVGDHIHYVRYARLAAARGGRLLLLADGRARRAARLLASAPGLAGAVGDLAAAGRVDRHCSLYELPPMFTRTVASIPAAIPYLSVDDARRRMWAERIAALCPSPGRRVGLVWKASPQFTWGEFRSVPLSAFAPLSGLPGCRLLSLQHDVDAAEAATLEHLGIRPIGHELDRGPDGFLDTAAVMDALDLVITVDTSSAHLAGALGRPVWTLIPTLPDWRWFLDRADSPWYPTMRLFRRAGVGEWDAVIAEVAQALRGWLGAS